MQEVLNALEGNFAGSAHDNIIKQEVHQIFRTYDTQKTGKLSRDDVRQYIKKTVEQDAENPQKIPQEVMEIRLNKIFLRYDPFNTGYFNFQ